MGNTKINLPDIPLRIVRVDGVTITGEGTRRSPLVASADSRAPVAHNQAESTITFTDITTGDVSISSHGYCPKLPNNTTTFLRGDGTYASPTGGGLTYPQTFSLVSLRV